MKIVLVSLLQKLAGAIFVLCYLAYFYIANGIHLDNPVVVCCVTFLLVAVSLFFGKYVIVGIRRVATKDKPA